MCNEQKIDIKAINSDERKILSKWKETKHIEGNASQMGITKDFWDILCKIIFLGYVDID